MCFKGHKLVKNSSVSEIAVFFEMRSSLILVALSIAVIVHCLPHETSKKKWICKKKEFRYIKSDKVRII